MPADFHPWIAGAVTFLVLAGMQFKRGIPADFLFLSALMLVTITGVLDASEALSGFSNAAIFTIGGLLAVSASLRHTGVLDWVGTALLGSATNERSALLRLAGSMVAASAFVLNAALVAMMMPVVIEWCRRHSISPSRLLIPLSYLAILGGVCTLIGTSTTIVVNGMLKQAQQRKIEQLDVAKSDTPAATVAQETSVRVNQPPGDEANDDNAVRSRQQSIHDVRPMRLFEIGWVGLPCAIIGTLYLITIGSRLLPNRADMIERLGEHRREYLVEMMVRPECRLIGQSVQQAGLRNLPGLFLIEVDRGGDTITPVSPQDVIHADDRLIFTGVVSTIVDLQKIPGLVPAIDSTYEFDPRVQQRRRLTEVVLSRTSPLIGKTVRQANFRQQYNAAVVAVHRNGERITTKVGEIELQPGDTLLLQTRGEFADSYRNSPDFYLVSNIRGAANRRHDRASLAAAAVLGLILWLSISSLVGEETLADSPLSGLASPAIAILTATIALIVTRCLPVSVARSAIDIQVLITIAAAIGLGRALEQSGAAAAVAETLVQIIGDNPFLLLFVIYLLAMAFTEMITNVAVVAMLIPLAISVAEQGGFCPRPFIMAITLAASLSFITPIGYHTNLMVMSPGGYRPRDYLKVGLPLAILVAITANLLIPIVWPF